MCSCVMYSRITKRLNVVHRDLLRFLTAFYEERRVPPRSVVYSIRCLKSGRGLLERCALGSEDVGALMTSPGGNPRAALIPAWVRSTPIPPEESDQRVIKNGNRFGNAKQVANLRYGRALVMERSGGEDSARALHPRRSQLKRGIFR
jgi:hypothetical protein